MRFFLLSAVVSLLVAVEAQDPPDVQLSVGIARGYQKTSNETSKPYNVYYGIPFAEPPINELRFKPPKPYVGSGADTVITSDGFRPSCVNVPFVPTMDQSEDCLFLNIFTPADASTSNVKKVLVFIHGGAFTAGSASFYVPTAMVTNNDIIVVTLQYRLAGFGFLSAGDDALPGNMGLKDMLLALQWIKANIAQFGGDADDITLSGESAGAMSCSALSIVPAAKDLFTKVILQSGTVISSLAIKNNPSQTFYTFAKNAGCLPWETNPYDKVQYHTDVVGCLQQLPTDAIIAAHPMGMPEFNKTFAEQILLTITGTDKELFPRLPRELLGDKKYLKQNGVLDRSYLLGVTDNEGLLVPAYFMSTGQNPLTALVEPETVDSLLRSVFRRYLREEPSQCVLDTATFLYTYPRDRNGDIPFQRVLQIQDDDLFSVPLFLFAHVLLRADPKTDIYVYLFDSEPKLFDPNGAYKGTCHTMDLVHEFDRSPDLELIYFYAGLDPVKFPIIRDQFRGYISDFTKTGQPISSDSAAWPLYCLNDEQYMYISSAPELRRRMHKQRVSFWVDFIFHLHSR